MIQRVKAEAQIGQNIDAIEEFFVFWLQANCERIVSQLP